jgi:N-methylhydantoinase A
MNGDGTTLDVEGAKKAVGDLGSKLKLSIEQTAEAILAVVNQRMAGRMRLMSIERGLDPRDFALVAFGGAGPLHGGALIREVGVSTMLVPQYPGVLCALGCAYADLRYDVSQTVEKRLDQFDVRDLASIFEKQRAQVQQQIDDSQVPVDAVVLSHTADMAYSGQIHSLRVNVQPGMSSSALEQAFVETYRSQFGNTLKDIPVVMVNLRTVAVGSRSSVTTTVTQRAQHTGAPAPVGRRPVHFGRWHDTPVYQRDDIFPGMRFDGPAIVEQKDTTTVIEPDMTVEVDAHSNLLVKVK